MWGCHAEATFVSRRYDRQAHTLATMAHISATLFVAKDIEVGDKNRRKKSAEMDWKVGGEGKE